MIENLYTMIAHSGLNNAVEFSSVESEKAKLKIEKANGVLVTGYKQATDLEYDINYKGKPDGIEPDCRPIGRFSITKHKSSNLFVLDKSKYSTNETIKII